MMSKSETRLERLAGWCLWITCWGPIVAIIVSLQKDVDYPFFIFYRKVVFPALLIQICLRLAQDKDPDFRKTALFGHPGCATEPHIRYSLRRCLALADHQRGHDRHFLYGDCGRWPLPACQRGGEPTHRR